MNEVFLAELVGTAILILLGNGVVANVLLQGTGGRAGGWICITAGWGLAVAMAVYCVGRISGAHINPAVTIALLTLGEIETSVAPIYLAGQFAGAAIGLSLGGPTGYAINPARDLAPRIVHALLPIGGKGDSGWQYSWVPVAAPLAGGVAGALLWRSLGF
jgi:glycerol uptake facilitator-like aquaporin